MLVVLPVAAGLVAAPITLARQARPAQAGPEYGIIVSGIAGGLQKSTVPVFTCPGPDLTGITEALQGGQAVRSLGLELVGEALGTKKNPWPRNLVAFTYQGRRRVPDFVKAGDLYVVDTGRPLDLAKIRDLQAIAVRRGGKVVVVTRKNAAVTPALSKAMTVWWRRSAGRVRVLRCI